MMKKVTLVVAFVAAFGIVSAQSTYKQAVGVRVSAHQEYAAVAASYKVFVTEPGAIELNLGVGNRLYGGNNGDKRAPGVSFSGVYQHHFDIKPVEGLRWYIGGGAVAFNSKSSYERYDGFGFGVFPTGGVDYKFVKIPLNLSADFRPTFHIAAPTGYRNFHAHDVGFAARFTF